MSDYIWNPWHGCKKYSEGCLNCYMYRRDLSVGTDPENVRKTASFDDALKKKKDGSFKFISGSRVYVCMTSDFFLDEADDWRDDIWQMIRLRKDLNFYIITKRIVRFSDCIPDDWGDGYDNVTISCTVENQRQCDIRLPVFRELPIKRKHVISEPLLGPIDMSPHLDFVSGVTVGGESGSRARPCDYSWVLDIRDQCVSAGVPFYFKQTGAVFIKDGKTYNIPRRDQQPQARRANINT